MKPEHATTLVHEKNGKKTDGTTAKVWIETWQGMLRGYRVHYPYIKQVLASKMENEDLKNQILQVPPTKKGIRQAYKLIKREYGASRREIAVCDITDV